MPEPLRVILMGTGPFAVPSFAAITAHGHDVPLVLTRPVAEVKSRGGPVACPVAQWAATAGLRVDQPASVNHPDVVAMLSSVAADLLVVCDYGQILKPAALSVTPLGGINLHGSLLPAYRGAAPVQRALLRGDPQTGVSVIHMTPRLDGGPILATAATPIRDDETAGQLEQRLSELGVSATLKAIDLLSTWDRRSAIGHPQDDARVSQAPRLSKAEALIDWSRDRRGIDCHVRGMQPWPVAFTFYHPGDGKPAMRLQIKQVTALADHTGPGHPPQGSIVADRELVVVAGDGLLRIDRLIPAGKKEMTGAAWVNGYQPSATSRLGGEESAS